MVGLLGSSEGPGSGATIQNEASLQGGELSFMFVSWMGACAQPGGRGWQAEEGEWIPARVTFARCMGNSKRGAKGLRRDSEVMKVGP